MTHGKDWENLKKNLLLTIQIIRIIWIKCSCTCLELQKTEVMEAETRRGSIMQSSIWNRMADALEKQEDGAVASAMVIDVNGQPSFSYWDLQSMWLDLLDTGLVTRRLFRAFLKTPLDKLLLAADGASRIVGALPGSFFMVKTGCFTPGDLKELFDKHVFLYYEEKILGQKLKKMGLKELLVTDASYVHAHSVSIDKSYNKISDKQKLLHKSKLYYYQHYLKLGEMELAVAKAFLAVVLTEVKFLTGVLKMRW